MSQQFLRRLLGETLLIFSGQNLAADRRGSLHHQSTHFSFEFDQHPCVIRGCSLTCFGHDLFGGCDGLLSLLLPHSRGRNAALLQEVGCLGGGLRHRLLVVGLGPRQLRLYLLGVGETLGDELTPLRKHFEDGPIGKQVENKQTIEKLIIWAIR